LKNKLKILAAGDIHGDTRLAKRLSEKAKKENVDLVILCGDLTYSDTSTSGIIHPFVKNNQKVVLIPGNHETIATANFLADLYGATNLHGYSIQIDNVGIFGCGSAEIGPHPIKDTEILKILKKGSEKIKKSKKKIMVTHVHPEKTLMAQMSNFVEGSKAVRKAVKELKPDFLFCSHVHEAEGIEEKIGKTTVINVGREGRIVEI